MTVALTDWYQIKSVVLVTPDKQALFNAEEYNNWTLTNFNAPVYVNKSKLSEIMVELGFCQSFSDFRRKLSEGAIKFGKDWGNAIVVHEDQVIDVTRCNCYEVRLRKKYAEILVPSIKTSEEQV